MKTYLPRESEIRRDWWLVDVADRPLGRVAVQIANLLRGKNKTTFTPHIDGGDFVVVVNSERVKLTGSKEEQKVYRRYSGYRGGLREHPASFVRERHPQRLIEQAVKGMIPRTALGRRMLRRLKVYAGAEHPHAAQAPKPLTV
jgi:large subunit ribosomal protein L13